MASNPDQPVIMYSPRERKAWVYFPNGSVIGFTNVEATVYHAAPLLPSDVRELELPQSDRLPIWAEASMSDDRAPVEPLRVGSPEHQRMERAYVDAMAAEDAAREAADDAEPARVYTSSRDAEPPADVRELIDCGGNTLTRSSIGNWAYTVVDGKPQSPDTGAPWCDLDDEYDVAWPLVEGGK